MKPLSRGKQVAGLVGWFAIVSLAAALGVAASLDAGSFYRTLALPPWAPPAGLFGPAWTTLYILMSISAWLVWRTGGFRGAPLALALFLAQLIPNALWSWLFFAWHQGGPALANIMLLWILLAATLVTFLKTKPVAALLLVPYLLWITFAAWLNYSVWHLNPEVLG